MPQRKDYDVYSGNQKIGEIWSDHPVKSDYETDLNIQIETVNHYFKKKAAWNIENTSEYQTEAAKKEKMYKVRKAVGILFIAISLITAVMNVFNHSQMENMFTTFVIPAIIFGFGVGLLNSDIITSTKRKKPVIDWKAALCSFALGGIGFFIIDFLVSFAIVQIMV